MRDYREFLEDPHGLYPLLAVSDSEDPSILVDYVTAAGNGRLTLNGEVGKRLRLPHRQHGERGLQQGMRDCLGGRRRWRANGVAAMRPTSQPAPIDYLVVYALAFAAGWVASSCMHAYVGRVRREAASSGR